MIVPRGCPSRASSRRSLRAPLANPDGRSAIEKGELRTGFKGVAGQKKQARFSEAA